MVALAGGPAAAVDVGVAVVAVLGGGLLDGEEGAPRGEADVEDEVGAGGGEELGDGGVGGVVGNG